MHSNSSSSPAPSNQLSSHSLLSSLTISPNNTSTDKYFHALSILRLWQPQNELPCSAINPVSLWSSIISSPCAILFAVNQLFWVWRADSSSVSFILPPSPPVTTASPCLSQFFSHSQVPNPPLSLWAFPTYIPIHTVTTMFQCSYQG